MDFRNYERLKLNLNDRFNVIFGENGQGKTNIIESVFLCASGRSHRTAKDAELIKIGKDAYTVCLTFEKEKREQTLEISYNRGEKKKIRLNEVALNKIGEMIGVFTAVIFSPEDLQLVKEGPSERRRFIDISLSQLRPSYFFDLQQYNKILFQRNSLLKDLQENPSLLDTLEVWDINLAAVGARITESRRSFLKLVGEKAWEIHRKLTGGREELKIRYVPGIDAGRNAGKEELAECFLQKLKSNRDREISKGTTMYGPQRDDFELFVNDMDLKQYGSQGQQRTTVLSLKLSEMEIMKEYTGSYPVLLLDDVMSELDKNRREYLLSNLSEVQTLITCTDRDVFHELPPGSASLYRVEGGKVFCQA